MPITIRRIRSFVAIADLGSFRKAAEMLSISQPALSGHIRDLEDELGVAVFRRTTRQIQLTDSGRLFLARIRRTLVDFDSAVSDMRDEAAAHCGHVIVACAPSIAANLLPTILVAFERENPRVKVTVMDERTEVIEKRVLQSEVDFAISPYGAESSDLAFEPILDDRYFAVFAAGHPLAGSATISLRRLADMPLIAMRPELNMRRILEHAALKIGVTLRPSYEVYNHDTLIGLVAAGLGVGAMPALTISMVRNTGVSTASIVDPIVTRQIGIVKRRGEVLSVSAEAFASMTRRHLIAAAGGAPTTAPDKSGGEKVVSISRRQRTARGPEGGAKVNHAWES